MICTLVLHCLPPMRSTTFLLLLFSTNVDRAHVWACADDNRCVRALRGVFTVSSVKLNNSV